MPESKQAPPPTHGRVPFEKAPETNVRRDIPSGIPVRVTDPAHPIVIVRPVQPVIIHTEYMPIIGGENAAKTIPVSPPKQFGNNSSDNSETIPNPNSLEPSEPAPKANITAYRKKGKIGRQRKYEDTGNHGEIPIKEVVLFRHIKGRHWPGMSQDMKEWYGFYYFSKPKRTEKAKDAEDYTRHCKSWERGQRWIAEHEGRAYTAEAMGDSGKVVAYRKRASS